MNNNLNTRQKILLAKIAGEDVSLETMTPPVAANTEEELMLKIADRLDAMSEDGSEEESVDSSGTFLVTISQSGTTSYSADKTYEEIDEAYNSGSVVIFRYTNLMVSSSAIAEPRDVMDMMTYLSTYRAVLSDPSGYPRTTGDMSFIAISVRSDHTVTAEQITAATNTVCTVTFTQTSGTAGSTSMTETATGTPTIGDINSAARNGKAVVLKYIPSGSENPEYYMLDKVIDASSSIGSTSYAYFSGGINYSDSKLHFTTICLQYVEAIPGMGTFTAEKNVYSVTPDAT